MAQKQKRFFRKLFAHARLNFITFLLVLGFGFVATHLYSIQILKGALYSAKAQSQLQSLGVLESRRGDIFLTDKNGTEIQAAVTRGMPVVYAVPSEIEDPESAAALLSKAIPALDKDELLFALEKKGDPFEPILRRPTKAQAAAAANLQVKGIYVEDAPRRFYPNGHTGAHVIGFISPTAEDDTPHGRYGLELFYEDLLRGKDGKFDRGVQASQPEDGGTLTLTIDYTIQKKAESILEAGLEKHRAKSGSVIVQNPKTGAILALANRSSFDPNSYSDYSIGSFLNAAVEGLYEPGSIFKIFTMAAGIDSGKISPETTYYDSGSVEISGRTIKNWDLKSHGQLTMREVLEKSLNTGTVFAERKMGHDIFYNYALKFGFSEKTGIDLPGELAGNLNNLKKFRDINFATASFGQGISVSPISLITAASAIANGGVLMKPYIVSRIKDSDGTVIERGPQEIRRVISAGTAHTVADMMVSAVQKNVIADIPNYSVAGKTGTAQMVDSASGKYYANRYINTYIGFAPAYDPEFIILIKYNDPEGAPLAGATVVPAFRELAEFIINYYGIAPDRQ